VLADGFQCPNKKNRRYAHEEYCDLYWECKDGEATEVQCPDGLVFDPRRRAGRDPCDNPFNVDCEDLEVFSHEPQKVHESCPRMNGIYAHPDPTKCHLFSTCVDGAPTEQSCPPGLIWSEKTGACSWPSESGRDNSVCKREEKLEGGFECPPGGSQGVHTRHENPLACDTFYLCLNGIEPRIQGCDKDSGFVFNDATKLCEAPSSLPKDHDCYQPEEESA